MLGKGSVTDTTELLFLHPKIPNGKVEAGGL